MKRVRISVLLSPVRDAIRLGNTFILESQNQSTKALRAENPILFFGGGRGARGRAATAKATIIATPAEPVLPYNGISENRGRMLLSCSPFSMGPQDGKNPAGQRFKGGDFFCVAPAAEKILPGPTTIRLRLRRGSQPRFYRSRA